jgi:hypothetical protein
MHQAERQHESGERIASFVFQGTVLRLHASNEPFIQATANTAILRVNRILYASEALRNYSGLQITLHRTGPLELRQGQEAIFFTEVLIYGQSLVVQEVEPRVESNDAMKGRLLPPERRLQQRIKAVDVIIQGEVLSVGEMQVPNQPISEHNPLWAKADVSVWRVLRGDLLGDKVTLFFPRSIDHMWYESPKFQPSQRGTWLLQFARIEGVNEEGYSALHPLDFQSEENADRVLALLEV